MAAAVMAANDASGSMPASPRNAPAANSSESPGRNGITTKPVSINTMAAMMQVPSTQFCASSAIRPCSLVNHANISVMLIRIPPFFFHGRWRRPRHG
ncbi:Uncharacterised protein [Achromobacter xylosoxidans]|nr:Uncharacterised protein [Achromobacter xylosoxidans]